MAATAAPASDRQARLEELYRDLHAHPELSFQEERTAGIVAARLTEQGYEVTTEVGGTGVVGVLRNGEGPTVLLRADMDALPVEEDTGLPYASTVVALDADGGHGSAPHTAIDPVVMAAATVMRLQGIVSREVNPAETAVVTVGSLRAGTKENIIPDDAELKINMRTFSKDVREHVLSAITRIVEAEAAASGAPRPPSITPISSFPLTANDPAATERVRLALAGVFGEQAVLELPAEAGSEDFGLFGTEAGVPSVFWFTGGMDAEPTPTFVEALMRGTLPPGTPANHSPRFVPSPAESIEAGVQAMRAAALAWLAADD